MKNILYRRYVFIGLCLTAWSAARVQAFEVRVIDPENLAHNIAGESASDRLQKGTVMEAARRLLKDKNTMDAKLYAWSIKSYPDGDMPPLVFEEVIVVVRHKSTDEYTAMYLIRSAGGPQQFFRDWQHDIGSRRIGLMEKTRFKTKPSEDDLVRFVHDTNFGNNEMQPDTSVLGVYCYVKEMKKLIKELQDGISREEKHRRDMSTIEREIPIPPSPQ
ncbi:MAG: hypothetical protein JW818_18990 [Pirellulales bacterium]|nr:hypothetical protein [Pirellulales bacterium]